ncbi:MAG: nucleotidyl transferase AbiEii/AbiGii toxin family protein [Bacteroidales bacterium]|nr:nucleotidyl transferase AbiEii/AbiGii toxin family protein [Bacteroidales bacterium]
MDNWLNLSKQRQVDLFNQLSALTGIQPQAIEKDAWVTLILRMIFSSEIEQYLVFKGGTSLNKAYRLIERFSEDIDIAIDRKHLGFEGELTKGEIRKLRRKSHDFVSTEMVDVLTNQLDGYGINNELYETVVENTRISDQDPETIKINYQSVFEEISYLPNRVLIELGARSLLEPYSKTKINSIIDEYYPESVFTENEFLANTVIPEKTFLEKMILLHEEFQKPIEKIRHERMSRHLYDIGQIIKTGFGQKAIKDAELFNSIIEHRKKFTAVKTVNYENLTIEKLKIVPPKNFYDLYKKDYIEMQENMIYGENLDFSKLIEMIKNEHPAGNNV